MATAAAVKKIVADQAKLHEAGVAICEKLYNEGEVGGDEFLVFDRLGWDKKRQQKEIARVGGRKRHQEQGDSKRYAAAQAKLAELEKTVPPRIQAIDAAIKDLGKERSSLTGLIKETSGQVDHMANTRRALRKMVPDHVRLQFEAAKHQLKTDGEFEYLNDAEYEVKHLRGWLAKYSTWTSALHREIVDFLKFHHGGPNSDYLVTWTDEAAQINSKVHLENYAKLVAEKKAYLAELEQTVPELRARYDAALDKLECETLDVYWNVD